MNNNFYAVATTDITSYTFTTKSTFIVWLMTMHKTVNTIEYFNGDNYISYFYKHIYKTDLHNTTKGYVHPSEVIDLFCRN